MHCVADWHRYLNGTLEGVVGVDITVSRLVGTMLASPQSFGAFSVGISALVMPISLRVASPEKVSTVATCAFHPKRPTRSGLVGLDYGLRPGRPPFEGKIHLRLVSAF